MNIKNHVISLFSLLIVILGMAIEAINEILKAFKALINFKIGRLNKLTDISIHLKNFVQVNFIFPSIEILKIKNKPDISGGN